MATVVSLSLSPAQLSGLPGLGDKSGAVVPQRCELEAAGWKDWEFKPGLTHFQQIVFYTNMDFSTIVIIIAATKSQNLPEKSKFVIFLF